MKKINFSKNQHSQFFYLKEFWFVDIFAYQGHDARYKHIEFSIKLKFMAFMTILISYCQFDKSYYNKSHNMERSNFYLQNGNLYLLINKKSHLALEIPKSDNPRKQSIIQSQPNQQNIYQLWMIEQVKPNQYQIVHFISTLVLQNQNPQLKLHFGSWKKTQLFYLKKFDEKGKQNLYQIRKSIDDGSNAHVIYDKTLKFQNIDYSDPSTIWELRLVTDNKTINKTCLIQYAYSGQVLDVPAASDKSGQKIIQYPHNRRYNQRWILKKQPGEQYYLIENAKSQQFLDIKGASQKQGTNIIQWKKNGQKNQLWLLQEQGKRLYLIRSALNLELLLGVEGNPYKQGANIVTTKKQADAFWRIIGEIPQTSQIISKY